MPVELEYKYVLKKAILNEVEPWHLPHKVIVIQQGYLAKAEGINVRVRHELSDTDKWFTTIKQKVNGETVEIHQEIDRVDGLKLWEVSTPKLTKTRHVFPAGDLKWEVDVFYHKAEIYLVMAEIEVPEAFYGRPGVPLFLKKHVILEVPLTDNRFSNTKLGDVEYTKNLYERTLLEYQHS